MVELTTNQQPYISTINDKKIISSRCTMEFLWKKRKRSSFQTGHPHIFKQKKFSIRKQTSLLIDVNILLEKIWIWKISTIFLTFMNILTYETYSKTTQTKNYTSSFKRIFNNFYFSVHSMMGHDEEICSLFLSKFPIEVHQSRRLTMLE